MDNLTSMSGSRGRLPGRVQTTLLGVVLGVLASIVAIGTALMVDVFVYEPIVHPNTLNPWGVSWNSHTLISLLLTSALTILLLALFVWAPSVLGGGLIGLILRRLAANGRLRGTSTAIVGALIGLGGGWAAAALALPTVDFAEWQPRVDILWAGLVGIGAGLFHSWLLSRWLQKRMTQVANAVQRENSPAPHGSFR